MVQRHADHPARTRNCCCGSPCRLGRCRSSGGIATRQSWRRADLCLPWNHHGWALLGAGLVLFTATAAWRDERFLDRCSETDMLASIPPLPEAKAGQEILAEFAPHIYRRQRRER